MAGSHIVIRLPTIGTVLGGILRENPGAIVRTIAVPTPDPAEVTFRAGVVGLPVAALGRLQLEWRIQYGSDPVPLAGIRDGLQMKLPIQRVAQPEMRALLRLDPSLAVIGNVAEDTWVEQWLDVPEGEAERVTALVQQHLPSVPGLQVRPAQPRASDVAAWQALRGARNG